MLLEWHTLDTVFYMRLLNTLSSGNCFGYHYCIYMEMHTEFRKWDLLIFTTFYTLSKSVEPRKWFLSVSSILIACHNPFGIIYILYIFCHHKKTYKCKKVEWMGQFVSLLSKSKNTCLLPIIFIIQGIVAYF